MNVQWSGLIGAVLLLVVTVELVRRRALREKYAGLWIVVSAVALVLAVFPGLLTSVSAALGFEVPANFLFAVAGLVLLFVTMQLSLEVGRLEDETQRLAEEVALLRERVERDDPTSDSPTGDSPTG